MSMPTSKECRLPGNTYPQKCLSPASDKSHECNLLQFFRNLPRLRRSIDPKRTTPRRGTHTRTDHGLSTSVDHKS
jgi:hypothetical protein